MFDLELNSQLVQRAFKVHGLKAYALEVQEVFGREQDTVGSRGNQVFAHARAGQPGVNRLTGMTDLSDSGAQLLDLAPADR